MGVSAADRFAATYWGECSERMRTVKMNRISRLSNLVGVAAAASVLGGVAFAEEAVGDPARGERAFTFCAACHTFDPAQRRAGPHLRGVVGRTAGTVEGFRYSPAMKKSGIVWTEENLRKFILNPRKEVPGTMMAAGLPNKQDIDHLIAFLRTKSEDAASE